MKVAELIEMLQNYPADMEVHTAYGYGDYWRTTVAPKVTGVFEGAVVRSDYHQMDKLVELDDDEMDSDARTVLILE
jgi:hypothetical protein